MNPVVQQILDSGADEDVDKEIDGGTRVIDLTDEEKAQNNLATTQVLNLAKIPVDTTCCKISLIQSRFSMRQFVVLPKAGKEPNSCTR